MNKAFVREPEPDGKAYCPRCAALGSTVGKETLDALVVAAARPRVGDSAWFCGFPRCDVAYFDLFHGVIAVQDLVAAVYPKDPTAPICPCFGFTMDEIEADVADGTPTRVRGLLARSQSPEAQCKTRAPDGRCCMREVQRLFMKLRSA